MNSPCLVIKFWHLVERFSLVVIRMEIDFDERHVLEEVDGTDFEVGDVETRALLQVLHQLWAALRCDEVDFVVLHVFRRQTLCSVHVFRRPNDDDEEQVRENQFAHRSQFGTEEFRVLARYVSFPSHGVERCQSDGEEEVSHFADRHRLRAITHDAEDGEESHRDTRLDFRVAHEVDEHEDAEAHEQIGEEEVLPAALREIEHACYDEAEEGVDDESEDEVEDSERIAREGGKKLIDSIHC